jgi:AraC-like DNA-binding protein
LYIFSIRLVPVPGDKLNFKNVIAEVIELRSEINDIWFAGDFHTPKEFSYQVNFPRLEIVIQGEYINEMEGDEKNICRVTAKRGDAIFIPPNSWNKPLWESDCTVLSILFGRRQMGLSLVSKKSAEPGFYDVQKYSLPTRSGFALDNILEALNSLSRENIKKPMDDLLLQTLLQYTWSMLRQPTEIQTQSRVQNLYQSICIYIQENFNQPISRDNIATRFNISSNHLSRMFRQQGHMTLADYITWVRIERAKFMLNKYNFKLGEVSMRCGFKDVNYFCRVFKNRTGKTPTQFRTSE